MSSIITLHLSDYHAVQGEAEYVERHAPVTGLCATVQVRALEWTPGTYTTRDDDGGKREGFPRRLFAWMAENYLIIQQDSPDGLFLLRGKSDGTGLAAPTLEAAKAAAQADYERRTLAALTLSPETERDVYTSAVKERDEARAQVAAAYEAAAKVIPHASGTLVGESLGQRLCCNGHVCGCQGATVGLYLQHLIRALTPADAKATYEAYGREKAREGMEQAAKIVRANCPECQGTGLRDSGGVHPWGEPIEVPCDCTDAILAAMGELK